MQGVRKYSVISPGDWGLTIAATDDASAIEQAFGISLDEVETRCRSVVYEWLPTQWNEERGAFSGYYSPATKHFAPPQLVNLIAPWLLLAAHDRYGGGELLEKARRAADWLHDSGLGLTHPMSVAMGGVLEPGTQEAWMKYSAEYVLLNLGIYARMAGAERFLDRAIQSGRFLVQSVRHDCAAKYVVAGRLREVWEQHGWCAFGRTIEALLSLWLECEDETWLDQAVKAGEYALRLQEPDGCFCLINGEYYNSDLAADPIRGLAALFEETGDSRFRDAALGIASWHVDAQSDDGSWPLTIDDEGNVVCSTVGPGDIPNIGIALLRMHELTGQDSYLRAALNAFRYSLSVQITPQGDYPYKDDPAACWGFWSWMPFYDYTVSADQATHHVRGLYYLIDYLAYVHRTH